jgi:hypothetical protein
MKSNSSGTIINKKTVILDYDLSESGHPNDTGFSKEVKAVHLNTNETGY